MKLQSLTFSVLNPFASELDKKTWDIEWLRNIPITEMGVGIQAEIFRALGIEKDYVELINNSIEQWKGKSAENFGVTIKDGLWIGIEGGVDRAIVAVELGGGERLVFEGAPLRPVHAYYNGVSKEEAIEVMKNIIEKELSELPRS